MQIILLRHGTRDYKLGDVPLNEIGKNQAQDLASDPALQRVTQLFSSPKKRALMTLEPLAEKLGKEIQVHSELDQMMSHESNSEFKHRVKNFLSHIETLGEKEVIIISSHSDWLNVALGIIPTNALHLNQYMFACAEYLSFEVKDGLWLVD